MLMPDLLQAISQGDTSQTSVWVATLLWVMGSKQHCTPKSRTPGLDKQDFKVVMSPESTESSVTMSSANVF